MTILPLEEQAALKALADACFYSLSAHVPQEAVTSRVPKYLRGDIKKALKKLRAKGFCHEHPTRGSTTWQLTPAGLQEARSF
jgi:hypothetical protein